MKPLYASFFRRSALLCLSMLFFLHSGFSETVTNYDNLASENVAFFNGDITLNCPSDITLTANAGQTGMSASWNTPTPSTTCVNTAPCTDKTLVKWDLDACAAFDDAFSYNEFSPSYPNSGGCASVTASKVSRENPDTYFHSCVAGVSGNAMCVSGTHVNYLPENSVHTVRFSATINANNSSNFSKLTFYASSPHTSYYENHPSRQNNYLRKFGVKVRRNGQVIFEKDNLTLTQSFEFQSIDFGSLLQVASGSATFHFELVAYDPVGNGLDHRVWDLDEIKLKGCCGNNTSPENVTVAQIAGPASGSFFPTGNTTITYRATDDCGNTKDCSFSVRVNPPVAPCANQGGDSDGDGVCDFQDNCDFTANPDQADNDGDGIGNVCDDTPNGDPCANQGGDSDGDGVCDNQDNCDHTANPDQADNDGDGIGNVCDDTPNGGGNGDDCNDVTVSGTDGKVTINNIPSGAKIEISGPSTNWAQELVCEGNCNTMEMVSNLTAGEYTITAQTFNPYCYNRITVTVTGGGGGGPCDNQGGDSDGDGVCDNQDNCDFTANPDQADNDGDGIGNVCDDTPNGGGNGGDCNDVTVSGSDGKVTIENIPTGAKVEISGPSTSWAQQIVCEGNCNAMEMVSSLTAGDYTVTVQTFNPYCYKQIPVAVTGGGGGGPCDNQGGDSDGDGVCDNQDNCDFTANPDQADNDGDGIGNVCDDTPNGGGNGDDCNDVTASGADGKVTINNIPSGAKIEISGPSTNWAQELVCEGNCNAMEMVSNLTAGDYTITAQTFNPYCYNRITVTVTGGGGGGPCDNQGGDSDGDGVCDNQDNCDFTANPDQADNDGDGIGNVCDDTPNGGGNGGDCNDVTVSGSDGKVTINNIPSSAKVEISGPSTGWGQQIVCEGNCATMEMVSSLMAGDYTVTVQTFNPYCYKQFPVTVTGGGGGGPCDNQGGDSDGDGVCDNQDNCDFTANPDQADNDGDGIGNACDDTPNGGGNGDDCNDVTVSGSDGKVTIENIPSGAKIEISGPSTNWAQELVCESNCNTMEMVSNLTAGEYTITAQTFNPYCYNRITVTVTGGGNPCDNQGGDSDGDGVCNNQDNCDNTYNPDQADNDGDGIGNACDDTPNGAPCANQGGDSDGDGVCDNQDNCDFTYNPDQADNDEDGIGNVCDDTPNGDPCGLLGGDSDGDGICDFQDNCDFTANPNQADSDNDGIGDVCDTDACNTQGGDSDGDGVCNNQDNCDNTYNPDQADNDGDGIGNVCDDTPNGDPCANQGGDSDGDGVCNNQDNCDNTYNPNQADSDNDGVGDVCDNDPCNTQGGDSDGDGVCNNQDNCDNTYNPDQADNDGDGIGNVCDDTPNGDPCANLGGDNDGDGVCAANDCDDNDANVPNNLPCDDGCNQNGCTKYRGNVDFKAIGNSMNYSEARDNCNKKSNSSANLSIPTGTAVKSATLYWSGSGSLDSHVRLNGQGVSASQTWTDWESSWNIDFFAASADVTHLVTGNGNYTVSSLAWNNTGNYCQSNAAYGAWSLVVIYEGGSTPLNTIQVCADDFRFTFPGGNYSNDIQCINVPQGCTPNGELTIIAFEGDNYKGENFFIQGQQQSGSNNFRGQTAPNLDIVTFNIDNYLNSNTSQIQYTIQSYQQNTIWGQAIEGLYDLVRIVKYGCGTASSSRNAPMLDFAAFPAQREVALQWVTNTGYKNDYFEIEKSIDGATFETLQRIANLDFTDDLESYNGIDPTPALGDNYYRVKQVYTDGSFDYTDVQNIPFNIDLENLSMYPNPAQSELNFNLKAVAGKSTNIQIINNFGQVVQSMEVNKEASPNVQLSLENMANGFYQVLIQVDGQKPITKKLIVERMY